MEFIGYACAIIVGISLGVLGAGGSILTIPTLLYLFNIDPLHATTYSFFIVGSTALIGAIQHIKKGEVQVMPALYFAATGGIVIYSIRNYLLESIPENVFSINTLIITKDDLILYFFSIIMTIAGISMMQKAAKQDARNYTLQEINILKLILLGLVVGIIIAFAGVGGGFLITPTLTLFGGLQVKKAIGTSLCIISLNSFTGFFSSLHMHDDIHWTFLFLFVTLAIGGVFAGMYIARGIDSRKMKRFFGALVAAIGIFILLKELFLKL
jgi:hypothetical protein